LREAIANTAPGTHVALSLLRARKPTSINAVLETRHEEPTDTTLPVPTPTARPTTELGFEAAPLTTELVTERRLPESTKGLLVRHVIPGSLAWEEGLTRDSIITGVNGETITTVDGLNASVSKAKSGETLTLLVLRARPGDKPTRAVVNITLP
jgi:S1-C subfamily serine protease